MSLRRGSVLASLMLISLALTACTGSNPQGHPSSSASTTTSPTPTTPAPSPTTASPTTASPTNAPTSPPNPAPRQVVGLTAQTGGGSGEVLLTWTQNSEPDVVSYIVYRALTPGGTLTRIGTASRHDVTMFSQYEPFVDSNATVGYYRVRAVDSVGQRGTLSVEVCGASVGHSC